MFPSQQRMLQQQNSQLAYNHQLMNQLMEMDHQHLNQQQQQQQRQQQQQQAAQRHLQQQQQQQQQLIQPSQIPRDAQLHHHVQMVPHQVPYSSQDAMLVQQAFHPQHPQMQQPGQAGSMHMHPIQFPHQMQPPLSLQAFSGIPDLSLDPKKKGNNFRAMNEKELKQLLVSNETRELSDVAKEVKSSEHSPRAEKTKQLFAMLWLQGACVSAKRSTPRSRVYAAYAARCGTEHVPPLNPASFGKLVRVIFPGIKTRRLGVRGESKYHYVDLVLTKELDMNVRDIPGFDSSRASVCGSEFGGPGAVSHMSVDIADAVANSFAAADDVEPMGVQSSAPSYGRLLAGIMDYNAVPHPNALQSTYNIFLQFTPDCYPASLQFPDDVIDLPNINEYLPPKTDVDAAEALIALYRTHCTSLIDCVRFCKEKQFFRLFTSFQGTLTVPVQKLFVHPDMATWVRECDWRMYQKMIRFVSGLALQVAPPLVMRFLQTVSDTLHSHIAKTFATYPPHLLESKLEPATVFSALLRRMLKVNRCAHEAAALLMSDESRTQMWIDWVQVVNPVRVIESEMPHADYRSIYKLLTHDVRELLQPSNVPENIEAGTFFQEAAVAAATAAENGADIGFDGETPVDRLAVFLSRLPGLFPKASARTILQTTSCVMDAALRDFTLASAVSFGSWWLTKIFIDEMGRWLAELGGFLSRSSKPLTLPVRSTDVQVTESVSAPAVAAQTDCPLSPVEMSPPPESQMGPSNQYIHPTPACEPEAVPSAAVPHPQYSNIASHDPTATSQASTPNLSVRPSPLLDHRSASMPMMMAQSMPTQQQTLPPPPPPQQSRPVSRLPPTGSFAVSKRRKPIGRSVSSMSAISAKRAFSALDDKSLHLTPPVTPDLVVSGLNVVQTNDNSMSSTGESTTGTSGLKHAASFSVSSRPMMEDEAEDLDDSGICLDQFPMKPIDTSVPTDFGDQLHQQPHSATFPLPDQFLHHDPSQQQGHHRSVSSVPHHNQHQHTVAMSMMQQHQLGPDQHGQHHHHHHHHHNQQQQQQQHQLGQVQASKSNALY